MNMQTLQLIAELLEQKSSDGIVCDEIAIEMDKSENPFDMDRVPPPMGYSVMFHFQYSDPISKLSPTGITIVPVPLKGNNDE